MPNLPKGTQARSKVSRVTVDRAALDEAVRRVAGNEPVWSLRPLNGLIVRAIRQEYRKIVDGEEKAQSH